MLRVVVLLSISSRPQSRAACLWWSACPLQMRCTLWCQGGIGFLKGCQSHLDFFLDTDGCNNWKFLLMQIQLGFRVRARCKWNAPFQKPFFRGYKSRFHLVKFLAVDFSAQYCLCFVLSTRRCTSQLSFLKILKCLKLWFCVLNNLTSDLTLLNRSLKIGVKFV